ncbi:MAG TPA: hypothetical protein VGP03_01405 [Pseudonocardiaceae bacterium]|jgi:hypothetical protein|nr:hypothetical protein [Pseudonocardiaceae bacterium]
MTNREHLTADERSLSTEDLLPQEDRPDDRATGGEHVADDRRDVEQPPAVTTERGEPTDDGRPTDTPGEAEPATHRATGAPADEVPAPPASDEHRPAGDDASAPLFTEDEVTRFRAEWRDLQADFVDSPQQAVQQADALVAQVMQTLAATFAEHKSTLEGQWSRGEEVQTEDLRLALRQYRSFFHQLLAV